eukprot:jgi/Mesen1/8685/ME000516S08008
MLPRCVQISVVDAQSREEGPFGFATVAMRDIVGASVCPWVDLKNPAGDHVGRLLLTLRLEIPPAAPAPAPPGALVSLEDTCNPPAPPPSQPRPPAAAAADAPAASGSADAKRGGGVTFGFGARFEAALKSGAIQKLLSVASGLLQDRQTKRHYYKLKED